MSQNYPTLSVLGIPDHNIKVAFVRHEYRGNGVRRRQYHVIDADSHRLITLLGDRFNRTVKNFFIAHYSLADRTRVQTVTMDMNAA
ncbi:transposase, partial [Lacticaseibacillus paracasei]|uniref:transposase n=1 Tax=Lacticaseibacillus paracasei TaxID=1597 RepID=UPI001950AE2C